ncbi:hypothetical protein WA158_003017 [Blastocystis sp. Blastoise]
MQPINYNQECVKASNLLGAFAYNQEYGLSYQLQDGVRNNKFQVAYSSTCMISSLKLVDIFFNIDKGVEDLVFLMFDVPIPYYHPSVFRITLTLMKQSYPLTVPVIHFSNLPKYTFNPTYSWFTKDGYLSNEILKNVYSTMTFSDLCDYCIRLVKECQIYIPINTPIPPQPKEVPVLQVPDILPMIDAKCLVFEKVIGEGGFGQCYKYNYNGRSVCIKQLPQSTPNELKYAQRELGALAQLNNPYILKMIGLTEINGRYMLITNYASEGDLYKYMKERISNIKEYTTSFCIIFMKVVSAVAACHKKNIVHRDLKPNNVCMDKDDNPTVIDFGLARVINDSNNEDITHCGTREYAAPEQFGNSKSITNKCDIYALGLLGYFIMTGIDIGTNTFSKGQSHLKMDPRYQIPFDPNLNKILYDLFNDCCQYDPDKRPSAEEIYSRLSTYKGPLYEHFI